MLTSHFIHTIQNHADELIGELTRKLQQHPLTPSYHNISADEIRLRSYAVYKNLGTWLHGKSEQDIRNHFQNLGSLRYAEQIPLQEVVFAVMLTKNNLLEFIRHNSFPDRMIDYYSEKELRRNIGDFYDLALYYTVVGYQNALFNAKEGRLRRERIRSVGATPEQLARL